MKERLNVHGVVSTIITPFKEDKSIDFEDLYKEIDLGSEAGLFGFLCPCNAMESAFMTEEEKLMMVHECVKAAAGRVNIISSVMAYDHDLRMRQCETYMNEGVDALCLNLPFKDEMTLDDYLEAVADLVSFNPKFILLQDSSMKDNGLPLEYMVEVFNKYDLVKGVKIEVKDSERKYTEILDATDHQIAVWGGFGNPSTIEAYDRGVIGMMPSGLFKLYSGVNKLYFEKDREHAVALFDAMAPILLQIYSGAHLGAYFHKSYFKKLGIFKTTVMRAPTNMDSYKLRICDETVDKAIALESKLNEFWK